MSNPRPWCWEKKGDYECKNLAGGLRGRTLMKGTSRTHLPPVSPADTPKRRDQWFKMKPGALFWGSLRISNKKFKSRPTAEEDSCAGGSGVGVMILSEEVISSPDLGPLLEVLCLLMGQ